MSFRMGVAPFGVDAKKTPELERTCVMQAGIPRKGYEWPREESNLRTRIRSPPLYPLSYGALCVSLPSGEPEEPPGSPRPLHRSASGTCATRRVADGTRTRDHRDHNPGLYQLSYRHLAPQG